MSVARLAPNGIAAPKAPGRRMLPSLMLLIALPAPPASTPVTDAVVGQPYGYPVTATDDDPGDGLTYSLAVAPAGMGIDPSTGEINGTATPPGIYDITILVTDPGGLAAAGSFTITVAAVNHLPRWPPMISTRSASGRR